MAGAEEESTQDSKPRRFRLRSSAGFASIGSAVALLAVSLAAFTGLGTSRSSIDLGSGFAWLSSNDVGKSQGQVVLANGATGQGVTKLNIDGVEDGEVRVEQRDGHAVVVVTSSDGTTRVLYRLDDQTLKNGVGRKVTGDDDVIRGGNRTYLVKQKLGTIQPIDSDTLQPKGRSIEYNTPILAAADDDGLLIVVQKDRAVYTVVTDDQATGERSLGASGDSFQISTIGGRPVVVNQTRNEVYVFRKGAPTKIAMPAGAGETLVAESGEGNVLAVLRRDNGNGTLVLVNLDKNEAKQAAVPGDASTFDAPLVAPDAVYLVDPQKGNVVVIDPTNGAVRAQKALPTGRGGNNTDTFVKDGYLWINNPNDQKAVVFDRDGNSKDVDKYRKDIPVINPVPDEQPGIDPGTPAPVPDTGTGPKSPTPVETPKTRPVATTTVPENTAPQPVEPPSPVANRPSAPPDLTAIARDRSIRLTWSKTPDGGAPIERYQLVCTPDCGTSPGTIDGAPQETIVEGLANGTSYVFRLSASNSVGDGPQSSASGRPSADVPTPPTGVSAEANNDGSVTVTWQTADEGLEISGFDIVAKSSNPQVKPQSVSYAVAGGQMRSFRTPTSGTDTLGFDDDNIGDYTFIVAARALTRDRAATNSEDSKPSAAVDPFKSPSFAAGQSVVGPKNGLGTSTQVSLTWPKAAANGRATTYTVEYCANSGASCGTWTKATTGPLTVLSTTVAGLTNGTPYVFRVIPTNDAGNGSPILSAPATPGAVPSAAISSIAANGDRTIAVVVTVNANSSGAATCAVTLNGQTQNCGSGGTFSFGGLAYATCYPATVTVANAYGTAAPVTSQCARTNDPPTVTVAIDVVTHLGGVGSPGICGGADGAGILNTPDDYYGATRLGCAQQNTQWRVSCQHVGAMITGSDGSKNNVWFRILDPVNGQTGWLSGMWISGSPTNLGLPGC